MGVGEGKMNAHINVLYEYLSGISLLLERNYGVDRHFSRFNINDKERYKDFWTSYFSFNYYDFQLMDGALLYFGTPSTDSFSYSYLGPPNLYISYEDFLSEFDLHENYENQYLGEYSDFLSEQEINPHPSYVRYDYSEREYNPGIHPVSHLHIGYNQPNRVGVCHVMSIMSFVAFILRQFYSDSWRKVLKAPKHFPLLYSYKNDLETVPKSLFSELDKKLDLYLV